MRLSVSYLEHLFIKAHTLKNTHKKMFPMRVKMRASEWIVTSTYIRTVPSTTCESNPNTEQQCCICYHEFDPTEAAVKFESCNHLVHRHCAITYFSTRMSAENSATEPLQCLQCKADCGVDLINDIKTD